MKLKAECFFKCILQRVIDKKMSVVAMNSRMVPSFSIVDTLQFIKP